MKNVLLVALFAAMPLMAQECPQKPECAPKAPCCFAKKHCGPRPELSEEQKAEMKAKFEARKAAFEAKLLEKFDADKDGKLSDAEKEAIKADFEKNAPKFRKHGPKGPRCCGKKGPRPHGPRPELSEEQKAEMKAKFEARKAEMLAKYDADKDGKLSCEERKAAHEARKAEMKAKFMEKFDADKDGQISDAEKEAIKAECKKHPRRCGKKGFRPHGPRPCCAPKCDQK